MLVCIVSGVHALHMTTNRSYSELVARGKARHGDQFDDSGLAPQFRRYYESGQRIRVQSGDFVRTGTVGVTTGWRPAFLLMHRSNASGSWDVLGPNDVVTHVQRGREYVPPLVAS